MFPLLRQNSCYWDYVHVFKNPAIGSTFLLLRQNSCYWDDVSVIDPTWPQLWQCYWENILRYCCSCDIVYCMVHDCKDVFLKAFPLGDRYWYCDDIPVITAVHYNNSIVFNKRVHRSQQGFLCSCFWHLKSQLPLYLNHLNRLKYMILKSRPQLRTRVEWFWKIKSHTS